MEEGERHREVEAAGKDALINEHERDRDDHVEHGIRAGADHAVGATDDARWIGWMRRAVRVVMGTLFGCEQLW